MKLEPSQMPNTMNSVQEDFKRFVHNIEQGILVKVNLSFATLKDLKCCTKYFVESAIRHPNISIKYAEAAQKLYFLSPTNEESKEMNFRKAIIAECQTQMEHLSGSFNTASEKIPLDRALGTVKFFGELYNVAFIFKGIIKKHLDIFDANKYQSNLSKRCYYELLSTIKEKVLSLRDSDYTVVIKSLIEMIEDVENNPPNFDESPVLNGRAGTSKVRKTSQEQFPALKNSPTMDSAENLEPKEDKITFFKRLLEELTPNNAAEVLKKFEESNKQRFEDETWHLYYEALIEKALISPELGDAIIDICQKLLRSNANAWKGVKAEDYKKYVHQLLSKKLQSLFDENIEAATHTQITRILNLIQKLLEYSISSLGYIATFLNDIIAGSKSNNGLAALILLQLMMVVKSKFNAKKIKKLPFDVCQNILQIIRTGLKGDLTDKIKSDIKDIAIYLDVNSAEESPKTKPVAEIFERVKTPEKQQNGSLQ